MEKRRLTRDERDELNNRYFRINQRFARLGAAIIVAGAITAGTGFCIGYSSSANVPPEQRVLEVAREVRKDINETLRQISYVNEDTRLYEISYLTDEIVNDYEGNPVVEGYETQRQERTERSALVGLAGIVITSLGLATRKISDIVCWNKRKRLFDKT